MVSTFYYDTDYDGPSFPTVHVTIHNLVDASQFVTDTAYIDSGADGTIIPLPLLQQINARKVDEMNLRWGSGQSFRVDIYEAVLQIASYRPMKVYAAVDRQEPHILLGRDVLNQFIISLNGIAEAVEISQ
ncbi:MAG: hypothetical protein H6645_08690 [Caldilineaceae bacterium]|nr:hypothetical protein [Caldilineaceae bacterium]MCB9157179.1 hypothetical protein [Caldilineaceae bacterium]